MGFNASKKNLNCPRDQIAEVPTRSMVYWTYCLLPIGLLAYCTTVRTVPSLLLSRGTSRYLVVGTVIIDHGKELGKVDRSPMSLRMSLRSVYIVHT